MYQKRRVPYGTFFVLLIIICAVCYVISGVFNIPDLNIMNLEEGLMYIIMHPLQAWNHKTLAVMALGVILWFWFVGYYLTYFRNYHDSPYGSEEWRDVHEANKHYRDKKGDNRTLTQNLEVSLNLRGTLSNNNMGIFASSGGYKTTALVERNILKFLASYVILDVKGELKRKWGKAFERAGYKVNVIDFKEPSKSDRFNPFVHVEKEEDIIRIGEAIHEAIRPKKEASMQDPFWDDAVKLLAQAFYSCAWLQGREKGKKGTMNDVMRYAAMERKVVGVDPITNKPVTEFGQYINELAAKYGHDYPPVRYYEELADGAPDTVASVRLMLCGMFQICETAEVKRIFEDNDINIREFGTGVDGDPNKKSVLFLCIPDDNKAYNWIVTLIYAQMISIFTRLADDEVGGPMPVRVEFFLDELYAGCRPPNLDSLLGIVRSRNMSMVLILQSIAQLQALYPNEVWKIIMDNLAVVIYAGSGPAALETHKYFSELIGKTTIDTRNDNIHHGNNANTADNFNQIGRDLMTPQEIKRMPSTDAIVLIEGSFPIFDTKAIPFDQEEKNYYAPEKLKKWYSELRSLGDYEHPVYTIYDDVNFHYVTISREDPMQIVTDKKDMEALQQAAFRKQQGVYTFNVNEEELLYLSWGHKPYTQENVEAMYKQAMEDAEFRRERLKGLIVLQNVEGADVPKFGTNTPLLETDKSTWSQIASLQQLMTEHWDDLSAPEQEEMCFGMDEGLTEEQLRRLMLCKLSEMAMWRRVFCLENQGRG